MNAPAPRQGVSWPALRVPRPVREAAEHFVAVGQEVSELSLAGPRALVCVMAALSVTISVALTSMAHLPDLWWAGISGFMSLQATHPGSVRRAILRVLGTAAGAGIALILVPWLAYDHVAFGLVLWAFAALAILGFLVSPHGYAWLFFGITFLLVSLLSIDDPTHLLENAFNRTAEVTIGSVVAVTVTWMLASRAPGPPVAPPPGWGGLLGAQFGEVLYALRGGFAVMLMPLVWRWMELPSLTQMPVTVAAVMAVPVAIADPKGRNKVIADRAAQRVIGCLFGGMLGLLCLALSLTAFLPWLALLGGGVFVAAHVQASARGVGYVGTQAAIAFIMALVQGSGPPTSIMPGFDRFMGVTLGLAVLLAVTVLLDLLFGPAAPAPGPARPADA
jgi:uncharacterized membrane protein YccC